LAAAVVSLELDLDACSLGFLPVHHLVALDAGFVLLGVDHEFEEVGLLPFAGACGDLHRSSGREESVHARSADPDPLLAAALAQAVELGAVE
jgi:hypothetical protein